MFRFLTHINLQTFLAPTYFIKKAAWKFATVEDFDTKPHAAIMLVEDMTSKL
jgi:hypothetical protein